MAAMVVIGSGIGVGEERRSENQSESISVRSQRSIRSQRAPGISACSGHGPGMTPMR